MSKLECECDVDGSREGECISNEIDGGCQCKEGYTGKFCDSCKSGYYGFPNCKRKLFLWNRIRNKINFHTFILSSQLVFYLQYRLFTIFHPLF